MCDAHSRSARKHQCRLLRFSEAAERIGSTHYGVQKFFQRRLESGFPGFLSSPRIGVVWECQLMAWFDRRAKCAQHGIPLQFPTTPKRRSNGGTAA